MTATEREGAELDDLRRRLYRADATDADLRQYLDGRAAGTEPEQVQEPQEAQVEPPRRPRRWLLAGAVAGVLVVCVAVTGVLLHRPTPAPPARAVATDRPEQVRVDVTDGTKVPGPGQVIGPATRALTLDGAAIAAEQFEGNGDGTLSIHLPSAEFGTLRATVLVSSSRTSTISWTALRPPSGDVAVVAKARVSTHVDSAEPTAFTYAGGPPTRIAVSAPAGLRWTILVAPTNGTSDDLR